MKKKVIFRADGNSKIGMGHFIRTLALAEMLKDEFYCVFATQNPSEYQINEIQKACHQIINLPNNDTHFAVFLKYLTGEEIVVLDNYYFTTHYQKDIKNIGSKLVCIDDVYQNHFTADIVINHSLSADSNKYSKEFYTKVYTGRDYILLRKEFREIKKIGNRIFKFSNVFLNFGGADICNLSYSISNLLIKIIGIEKIVIVLGDQYKGDINSLEKLSKEKIEIHRFLNAHQMTQIMQLCNLAIIPASGIAYECAAAGLPIILGYYLDHQKDFYSALAYQKNVIGIGEFEGLTTLDLENCMDKLLKERIDFNDKFIDGKQKERFINIFCQL